jgi:hypothetical protein
MKITQSRFSNELVKTVSDFLQEYMNKNNINQLTADQCTEILMQNNILPNNIGPKPGFNFRQMLRDGRDKKIHLVIGANQERPNTRWYIFRKT